MLIWLVLIKIYFSEVIKKFILGPILMVENHKLDYSLKNYTVTGF